MAAVNTDLADLDEDSLVARQKKEKKELQANIQKLKKTVPKGDKKKKKDVDEEISKLEQSLNKQHIDELEAFRKNTTDVTNDSTEEQVCQTDEKPAQPEDEAVPDDEPLPGKKSKAQKRRDKKQAEGRERASRIKDQAKVNKDAPRHLEMMKLRAALKLRGLTLHEIAADGNCMYNAISHQLSCHNRQSNNAELRQMTADYMRSNRDDFLPFLTHPSTGDMYTEDQYEAYCDKTARLPVWGGQVELRALSEVLKVPIEVIQADTQPVVIGEDMKSEPVTVVYHRHVYRLGEHYNSVRPVTPGGEEGEEEEDGEKEEDEGLT